jgi:hypothetical protein
MPGRLARRTAIILALALPALGWLITAGAVPAQACNTTSHCYAAAISNDTTANHGMYGNITSSCLYNSNDGNFVTQEIWDTSSGATDWDEVGLIGGTFDGTYYSVKTWFYAYQEPGEPFTLHAPNTAAAGTNISYAAEVIYLGSNEWAVYAGNNYTEIGTITGQSATLDNGIAGTEYTSYAGADLRDSGVINNLERESTGNIWYPWGKASQAPETGYFYGSYSNAEESWDWSC